MLHLLKIFPPYSNTTAAQCIMLYYQIRKKVAFLEAMAAYRGLEE